MRFSDYSIHQPLYRTTVDQTRAQLQSNSVFRTGPVLLSIQWYPGFHVVPFGVVRRPRVQMTPLYMHLYPIPTRVGVAVGFPWGFFLQAVNLNQHTCYS